MGKQLEIDPLRFNNDDEHIEARVSAAADADQGSLRDRA